MIARAMFAGLMALLLRADTPSIPEPDKADVPYLLMADNLVITDAAEAQQESRNPGKKKEETLYWIAGEHASAKTPLASPVFLLKEDTLAAERLAVYAFDIRDGRREAIFARKKGTKSYTLTVTKVREALYRMEVNESLPAGEYAISPAGSNQVFCFSVF